MKDDTTADGGASRRQTLAAIGGTTVAAALAGRTAILGDEEEAAAQETEVSNEPIEAGFQTFTEGPAAVLGIQTQYGVETAVRRIDDAGGIAGREIELDVVHEGDARQENYIQFVESGRDVTFGPTSSGGRAAIVSSPSHAAGSRGRAGSTGATRSERRTLAPRPRAPSGSSTPRDRGRARGSGA